MSIPTSSPLLALLSPLQQRREWSGPDLADQLDVGPRAIRCDVEKIRGLGYPVEAAPGIAGGYRLGAGAVLPPLLLDDAEAVAVAVGLRRLLTAEGSRMRARPRGGDDCVSIRRCLSDTRSMAEPDHPLPNLAALRAHLPPGLARELVDQLAGAATMADVSQVLTDRLRQRTTEIQEGSDATPEMD